MAQRYGFRPIGSRSGLPDVLETRVSTEILHFGDLVKYTSGLMTVDLATAGATILGVVVTANDASGDINLGASVQINVTPGLMVVADASTAVAPTPGVTYDLVGTTGAQNVNVAGGANGGMRCIQAGVDGDASMGIYELTEVARNL